MALLLAVHHNDTGSPVGRPSLYTAAAPALPEQPLLDHQPGRTGGELTGQQRRGRAHHARHLGDRPAGTHARPDLPGDANSRAQSRATATLIPHGYGLVFTTRDRPVRSVRGWWTARVRHGVSVIRSGRLFTLGLVFHDAT